MLDGFQAILDLGYWAYLIIGVVSGVAVGALPGFTATMGIALLLPFSYTLGPTTALGMLAGLYVSSNFADAVPACLVNTPGTPASMATAFDGFPMTQQGRGQEALVASGFSALIGTLFGGISFLLIAPVLSRAALAFGPPEFFWAGVFALWQIASQGTGRRINRIAVGNHWDESHRNRDSLHIRLPNDAGRSRTRRCPDRHFRHPPGYRHGGR